jgi:PAS domain-containing protein
MKKIKLILIAIVIICIEGCSEPNYTYVEVRSVWNEKALKNDSELSDEVIINANSDSAAYCIAYEMFMTTLASDLAKEPIDSTNLVWFILRNSEGKVISESIEFEGRHEFEDAKYEEIFGYKPEQHMDLKADTEILQSLHDSLNNTGDYQYYEKYIIKIDEMIIKYPKEKHLLQTRDQMKEIYSLK